MALIKYKGFAVNLPLRSVLLGLLLLLPVAVSAAVCPTPPTLSFDSAGKYADRGGSVEYIVTVTNNDSGSCSFPLSTTGDSADITSAVVEASPLTVGAGASANITLRVTVAANVADWTTHVTTLDVDETTATATSTVNNRLLHNSVNVDSDKHGGKWGTPEAGAIYGSITCQTCHVKDTNNIKRIRTLISTPDDTVKPAYNLTGQFPGDGQAVVFTSVVDNSADMGDDSDGHVSSDRICETCHSYDVAGSDGVRFHAYDMSAGGADLGHYNSKDCLQCHPHNAGFKASCASCHGGGTVGSAESNFWPDESSADPENDQTGRHEEHMIALTGMSVAALLNDPNSSDLQKAACAYCHDNPGFDADHTTAGTAEVAMHPVWSVGAAATGSYTTADGNCTNLCHNNKATGVGSYGWLDAGTSACIMCHNDINITTAGTTGATHDRHLNLAADFGPTLSCSTCHDGATDWGGNVKPASGHLDGVLVIAGSKVAAAEYNGTSPPGGALTGVPSPGSFGSCGAGTNPNACHNDGSMSVSPARAYTWGSTLADDCASCHSGVPNSGSHPTHVQNSRPAYGVGATWADNASTITDYDFGCGNCHGNTKASHLNGLKTVTGVNFTAGVDTCSTNACHHNGQNGAPLVNPTWGTSFTAGACNQCHGNFPTTAAHPQHTLEVSFHYDAVYSGIDGFLPVIDTDPVPAGLTGTIDALRGHGNPALEIGGTAIVSCNTCHILTVDASIVGNDLATYNDNGVDPTGKTKACSECHGVGATALAGSLAVTDKRYHVNGTKDVRFIDKRIRSKAQLRDENIYTVAAGAETAWTDTAELTNNWHRFAGYKALDGSSYDEQPDTLHNMAVAYGGANYYDSGAKTCMISCHLWESGRVDKAPVHWIDNATGGSAPLMCIDCHSRLPK